MDIAILETNLVTGTFWASLISFLLFLISIVTKKKDAKKSQVTSILGYIGMIFTGITSITALVAKGLASNHVPWSNFYESMVLMTALSTVLFLIVYKIYKQDVLGVIMPPGIVILIGIASILPANYRGNEPLVPALQSYWIKIHTTSMIVSYSVFLLATTTAIAYLVMYMYFLRKNSPAKELRENIGKLSLASTGPSLDESSITIVSSEQNDKTDSSVSNQPNRLRSVSSINILHQEHPIMGFMDDITYRMILLGFPILAFGIITGAMWANHAWGNYWSWDPKETASLMSWLFYGAYIHSRLGMSVQGKTSAIIAVFSFVAILFTYYGVNYLPGLHSYGFSVE